MSRSPRTTTTLVQPSRPSSVTIPRHYPALQTAQKSHTIPPPSWKSKTFLARGRLHSRVTTIGNKARSYAILNILVSNSEHAGCSSLKRLPRPSCSPYSHCQEKYSTFNTLDLAVLHSSLHRLEGSDHSCHHCHTDHANGSYRGGLVFLSPLRHRGPSRRTWLVFLRAHTTWPISRPPTPTPTCCFARRAGDRPRFYLPYIGHLLHLLWSFLGNLRLVSGGSLLLCHRLLHFGGSCRGFGLALNALFLLGADLFLFRFCLALRLAPLGFRGQLLLLFANLLALLCLG